MTVRAFDKLKYFKSLFINSLEMSANGSWCFLIPYRWIGFNMDMSCIIFSSSVVALAVGLKGTMSVAEISYTL